jgi:hypothetical protein
MARGPDSTARLDLDSLRKAEDTLRALLAAARPDDAWAEQFIQAIPRTCGASQRLFPLLALVPVDCQEVLGKALFSRGMLNASEALWLGTVKIDRGESRIELPDLTDRQEALALIGFDWDARHCPACSKLPIPLIHMRAATLVTEWTGFEVHRFGWPLSCRPETAARSCPGVDSLTRGVRKDWEELSDSRFRAVIKKSLGELFTVVLPFSATAVMLYLLLSNSLESWSLLVPSALPIVPAAWGVNRLTQDPTVAGKSLIPWSTCALVGALYALLPELLLVGLVTILDEHLSPMAILGVVPVSLASALVYAVAIRHGEGIPILRQLYPQPGEDPTAPG